jgi:long-chain acyl-CoA synthetase
MADEKPWLSLYPKGVPANIDADAYPTLTAMLDETFKKFKHRPAFSCMGKTLTFAEVDQLSTQFGAYLHSRGLQPGDRIALMMPNLAAVPDRIVRRFAGRFGHRQYQPAVHAARDAPSVQ